VTRRLAVVASALFLAASAHAAPPGIDATAYLVQNGATGEVLAARNETARVPIASITKLMTVLVVLERARPDELVTVPAYAAAVGESTARLRAGERITVRDLVAASLIQSANDATYALAHHVGKGDVRAFVRLMNAKARRFGMTDTRFARPDGLDAPGHYSSARDVTLLGRVAMRNPVVRGLVDDRAGTIAGGRSLHTWNDLLGRFPGLVGVKTGHTTDAGWSQVAAVRAPGYVLYATLLGGPTRGERNRDLEALLRWGLARYRLTSVVSSKRTYARADVGYGRRPVALVAENDVVRSVRVDRPLREQVVAATAVRLPVRKGQRLGVVRVWSGDRLLARRPLVAARTVEKPGLLGRAAWYGERTVDNILGVFT
jgi:serine-type D-Ala-D-Ala carboxypeptidase (penicillin-binding protein 5/6)